MVRQIHRVLYFLLFVAALCGSLFAQTDKTVTVRLLDSRTGKLIVARDFLVRINHEETVHANWVVQNDDGTAKLTVPQNTTLLALQARFDMGMTVYVNCDSAKDKDSPVPRWYALSDILASGVAAPNGCSKRTALAQPGEFVFYVRKQNWQEQMKDYSY